MACCSSFAGLIFTLLLLVVSLTLTLIGILTDCWFFVDTKGILLDGETVKRDNYHFGFWRKCYDNLPSELPLNEDLAAEKNCVLIYGKLTPKSGQNLTTKEDLLIELSRSYIGLTITFAAVQLATILILLCGTWPGRCGQVKRPCLYVLAVIVQTLATMCGVAAGICFLAARDVEVSDLMLYTNANTSFGYSFMLHWIATGISFCNGVFILILYRWASDYVHTNSKLR
ncbi:uncharacterized protein LOC131938729 [Physella acuta]|uniref:uncharacterized protein LOC131938729 n=1 Tax=Physella acuta TaxID=109671 RepID=UPI0027DE5F61|nr:uncharacterized protein LOC131938729 [Physella acuta]